MLLLKNIDVERGLVNGAHGVVRGFENDTKRWPRVYFAEAGVEQICTVG